MARCSIMTPLGLPVVPLVNKMVSKAFWLAVEVIKLAALYSNDWGIF